MLGKSLFRRRQRPSAKAIVITAEKTETYVIRQQPAGRISGFCAVCAQEVNCLTVEQTTGITGLTALMIFRLVERGELHPYETSDGQLLLCPNSIVPFIQI